MADVFLQTQQSPNHSLIRATLHSQRYAAFFNRSCRSFAHRAFCAAPIRLLADTDMWRCGRTVLVPAARPTLRPRPRMFRLDNADRAASTRSSSFSKRLRSDCNSFTARSSVAIGSPLRCIDTFDSSSPPDDFGTNQSNMCKPCVTKVKAARGDQTKRTLFHSTDGG